MKLIIADNTLESYQGHSFAFAQVIKNAFIISVWEITSMQIDSTGEMLDCCNMGVWIIFCNFSSINDPFKVVVCEIRKQNDTFFVTWDVF